MASLSQWVVLWMVYDLNSTFLPRDKCYKHYLCQRSVPKWLAILVSNTILFYMDGISKPKTCFRIIHGLSCGINTHWIDLIFNPEIPQGGKHIVIPKYGI